MSTYEHITRTATRVCLSWSNKEKALFHYFNPNGLRAQKSANDDKVRALVDAGLAKSGALIAYGGLNYRNTDALNDLANGTKKRIGWIELATTLEMIQYDIKSASEWIASVEAEASPKPVQVEWNTKVEVPTGAPLGVTHLEFENDVPCATYDGLFRKVRMLAWRCKPNGLWTVEHVAKSDRESMEAYVRNTYALEIALPVPAPVAEEFTPYRTNLATLDATISQLQAFRKSMPQAGEEQESHRTRLANLIENMYDAGKE